MSFLTSIVKKFYVAAFFIAIAILFAPFANDATFSTFNIPSDPDYPEGDLTLNNAQRIFEGELRGPECFAIYEGELYFSTHGGWINKIVKDKFVKVLKTGQKCDNHWWNEVKCGRPLGITFDETGHLFIADAYNGIFMTDLSTGSFNGKLEKIVSLEIPIAGKKPNLPNALVVSKDRFIYWTDSSSKHRLHDSLMTLLADGDGRLMKYNRDSGKNTVLLNNIKFANGVALSKDESFLVVAETGLFRVHKYHLKGPKAGTSEIFLDNLPGVPDNIRLNNDGHIIISLINPVKPGSNMLSILGPLPLVRKLMYKTLTLVDSIFIYLNEMYPNDIFAYIQNWVGHFESLSILFPKDIKILFVSDSGKIIKIHRGNDGKVSHVSDCIQHNGYYYLGSPFNNYLGKVKRN